MPVIEVADAAARLSRGEVVAIPTETVYGLAGRIDREDTLRRIFTVKERPFFDPLIVHVASPEQARALTAQWPEVYDRLASVFWPGPLTLVARKSAAVSGLITSGLDTVALRQPNHPVAEAILKRVGVPLAAPSANRFGRTSPTRAEDVEAEFGEAVPVVDGGPSTVGVESTIVQAEPLGGAMILRLLRPGAISRAQLRAALPGISIIRDETAAAPGNMKIHYQPANPVVIGPRSCTPGEIGERLGIQVAAIHWLHLPPTPELAARVLYSEFRRLSQSPGVILVERTPENTGEEWEAIWDRIQRAATLSLDAS